MASAALSPAATVRKDVKLKRNPSRLSDCSGPVPSKRETAGTARVVARDRWNARELCIQEILNKYDHDWSLLESPEFQELVSPYDDSCGQSHQWTVADSQMERFNQSRAGTPVVLCHSSLGITDLNGDGKVQVGELHYAMRAWDAFKNPDFLVLRHFATFDTVPGQPIQLAELQALLTELNDGRLVDLCEVRTVMELADPDYDASVSEASVLSEAVCQVCRPRRPELLSAIAIWFTHIERQDTDLQGLMGEAMMHSLQDVSSPDVFGEGGRMFEQATKRVLGRYVDYAPVGDTSDTNASPSSVPDRLRASLPGVFGKLSKYLYGFFPPLFSVLLIYIGWAAGGNDCPRNLDGLLIWFGLANILQWALMHTGQPRPQGMPPPPSRPSRQPNNTAGLPRIPCCDPARCRSQECLYWRWMPARVAVAVVLGSLMVVGFMWTMGGKVQNNMELCGYFLVHFSEFIWITTPGVLIVFVVLYIALKLKKLKQHDVLLQRSSSLSIR